VTAATEVIVNFVDGDDDAGHTNSEELELLLRRLL
jgi:hypothetical protein